MVTGFARVMNPLAEKDEIKKNRAGIQMKLGDKSGGIEQMYLLQMIQRSKIYFLLLIVILLAIPSLLAQTGANALGWQAFHPIILPVLVAGWGLIFFVHRSSAEIAGKTACIVIVCGLLLIAVQPIFNGYDEREHFFKVIASLDGKGLRYGDYDYEISSSFFALRDMRGSAWWVLGDTPWSTETAMASALLDGRAQPTYPVWGYLFSMIGVGITRFFHAPLYLIYLMGKIMNLVGFVCMGTWALKITPKYKNIFAVFMCMPATLLVVCAYHSDATTYGLIMLILAYFLKWKEQEEVPLKEWILWNLFLFLLVPLKFPYIGLLGLLFLLPGTSFRFARYNLWKGALILVVSVTAVLWSTQISSNFVEWSSLGFDRGAQIHFVITHPLETLWIFVSSIFSQPSEFIDRAFGISGFDSAILPGVLKEAHIVLVCVLLLLSEKANWKKWQKCWIFFMILGIWLLTDLALYITFTPVGSIVMHGVQGRYLTPLLLLGALIWPKIDQTGWKRQQIDSAVCYCNIIFAAVFVLGMGYYFYYN